MPWWRAVELARQFGRYHANEWDDVCVWLAGIVLEYSSSYYVFAKSHPLGLYSKRWRDVTNKSLVHFSEIDVSLKLCTSESIGNQCFFSFSRCFVPFYVTTVFVDTISIIVYEVCWGAEFDHRLIQMSPTYISVRTPPLKKKHKKTRTWAKVWYFWDVLNFGFLQQARDFGFPIFTNVWGFEVSSVSAKRFWNVERPGPGIGKRIGKRGRWPYLVTRVVVSNICLFSPRYLGKGFPFWRAYCSNGLQPPTSNGMSTLGL